MQCFCLRFGLLLQNMAKIILEKVVKELKLVKVFGTSTTIHNFRLTLVSMWNSAPRGKLNFYFSTVFLSIDKIFVLAGKLGTGL